MPNVFVFFHKTKNKPIVPIRTYFFILMKRRCEKLATEERLALVSENKLSFPLSGEPPKVSGWK